MNWEKLVPNSGFTVGNKESNLYKVGAISNTMIEVFHYSFFYISNLVAKTKNFANCLATVRP